MGTGYKYTFEDTSQHGKRRLYFWRGKGHKKIRIKEPLGSPAFQAKYAELLKGSVPSSERRFSDLVKEWALDPVVLATYSARTLYVTKTVLEALEDDPTIDQVDLRTLEGWRDAKVAAGHPEAANNRCYAVRRVLKWAKAQSHLAYDPSKDLEDINNPSDGWHVWTSDELAQFEKRWPIGTTARLCLDMAQYLGLSRADLVVAGQANLITVDGVVSLRYNRVKTGIEGNIALPEAFARTLAATNDKGTEVWLLNAYRRPFTFAGLGNRFKEWSRAAELPDHCTLHGVRKAAATRAAENGATAHQLMAMFAWLTLAQAELYTRQANRRKLGLSGAKLLKKG